MMERKNPALPAEPAPKTPPAASGETVVAVGILAVAVIVAGIFAVTQRATRSGSPPPPTQVAPGPAHPPPVATARTEPQPSLPPRAQAEPPPPTAVTRVEPAPPPPSPPVAATKTEPATVPPASAPNPPIPAAPAEVTRSEPPAEARGRSDTPSSERSEPAAQPSREPLPIVAERREPPAEPPAVIARGMDGERGPSVSPPASTPPPPAPAPENRPIIAAAPPAATAPPPPPVAADNSALARALQRELKRVGCFSGEPDGVWGEKSRSAFKNFVKHAKLSADGDEPSAAVLDAATAARTRVCPLVCEEGEHVVNGRCVEKARRVQAREPEERRARPRAERHAEPPSRPRERAESYNERSSNSSGGGKLCFGAARNELVPCK